MTNLLSRIATIAGLVLLAVPLSVFAQDSPKAGIVMGVPASFSVIWNVTDKVAVRPEIAFTTASTTTSTATDVDSHSFSPGVSALFYLRKWDAVRTYVSPLYIYRRATSAASSGSASNDLTSSTHNLAGSFGAEFAAHRWFGVFGEVGIGYTHGSAESSSSFQTPTVNAWNVRTAVGAILYF